MNLTRALFSWLAVVWMCFIFLGSLPYKFTRHPDTQHIFGTIGDWLGGFIGTGIGGAFREYGGFVIGGVELVTSLILLAPIPLWLLSKARNAEFGDLRRNCHAIGGLLASAVMAGAVFFHLFSPLGVEVLHEGESDGGSLFYSAVSVLVLGIVLFVINRRWGH